MFTAGAMVGGAILAILSSRGQADSADIATNAKQSRQDLRLIAYLLFGVIVLLGIIADRL